MEMESLMQGCCRALLELSGANRCSIMVLESDTEHLSVRWAQGSQVQPKVGKLRFRVGEGLCGWVARSQKAFCSTDATKEMRFLPRDRKGRHFRPVRTLYCLPLLSEGRTVGVVNLSSFSSSKRFRWIRTRPARQFLDRLGRVIAQATLLHEAQAVTQRLRRQAKTTSETVAQVSHEIRTPLVLILEGSQQMIDGLLGALEPSQMKQVGIIRAQAERMLKLVTELLDLSRIEAGRLALERVEMGLSDIVRDVAERYGVLVAPRRLDLHLDPVPSIYGDRSRLTQVLENLVTNAVKFTPADGRITVVLRSHGRWAQLSVADTGVGISPKDRRRLFEKFSQLKVPASLGARGTGLGLTIVKEVTHLHGGTVHVASEPGKGTTFTVDLPIYGPAFAVGEEFRVLREQAAREGRVLAVLLLRAEPGEAVAFRKLKELMGQQVSREDRILENPGEGILILSVMDPEGLPVIRGRIEQVLRAHPEEVPPSGFRWGWALVPTEETTLQGVLALARERAASPLKKAAAAAPRRVAPFPPTAAADPK